MLAHPVRQDVFTIFAWTLSAGIKLNQDIPLSTVCVPFPPGSLYSESYGLPTLSKCIYFVMFLASPFADFLGLWGTFVEPTIF